jgi:hypothetical protein
LVDGRDERVEPFFSDQSGPVRRRVLFLIVVAAAKVLVSLCDIVANDNENDNNNNNNRKKLYYFLFMYCSKKMWIRPNDCLTCVKLLSTTTKKNISVRGNKIGTILHEEKMQKFMTVIKC